MDELHLMDTATLDKQLDEYSGILESERAALPFWVRLVEEVWRLAKWRSAMEVIDKGVSGELSLRRSQHATEELRWPPCRIVER